MLRGRLLAIATTFLVLPTSGAVQADHELDNRDIVAGEELYGLHCASCHGAELQGQPNWQTSSEDGTLRAPPHDETGHTWHHDNQLLFEYTYLGGAAALAERGVDGIKSGMPGFSDVMSETEICNVLAYIRSTWPERVQKIQSMRNLPHESP